LPQQVIIIGFENKTTPLLYQLPEAIQQKAGFINITRTSERGNHFT